MLLCQQQQSAASSCSSALPTNTITNTPITSAAPITPSKTGKRKKKNKCHKSLPPGKNFIKTQISNDKDQTEEGTSLFTLAGPGERLPSVHFLTQTYENCQEQQIHFSHHRIRQSPGDRRLQRKHEITLDAQLPNILHTNHGNLTVQQRIPLNTLKRQRETTTVKPADKNLGVVLLDRMTTSFSVYNTGWIQTPTDRLTFSGRQNKTFILINISTFP